MKKIYYIIYLIFYFFINYKKLLNKSDKGYLFFMMINWRKNLANFLSLIFLNILNMQKASILTIILNKEKFK